MNQFSPPRFGMSGAVLVLAALAWPMAISVASAQQAPAQPPAVSDTPPATAPAPAATPPAAATPAPAAPSAPAIVPDATDKTVEDKPAPDKDAAGKNSDGKDTPDKAATADPFGQEVMMPAKTVVTLTGTATWETAFETISASFRTLSDALKKQNITPSGPFIVVYTSTDDAGFTYLTKLPVDHEPKDLPKGLSLDKSPEGKMLKFVHRGSYDNMDNTYEAITNFLEERNLEARDMFIEEYLTDPLTTAEDKLVINVFVPLK